MLIMYGMLLVLWSTLFGRHAVRANYTISLDDGYVDLAGISICHDVGCAAVNSSCLPYSWGYSFCKCDVDCRTYNDCCYNYAEVCLATADDKPRTNIHTNMACIPTKLSPYANALMNDEIQALGYFMIDKCPSDYTNSIIIGNCEQVDPLNWLTTPPETWSGYNSKIPVSDTQSGSPYKNLYCAWCNGVAIENIQLWKLHTPCFWETTSPRECGSVYAYDGSLIAEHRNCILLHETKCPPSADEITSRLCDSYSLPVTQDGRTYKNPHCAVCHEPSLNGSAVCSYETVDDISFIMSSSDLPQFLPFDFYSQVDSDLDDSTPRCAASFYYNSTMDECVPLYPEIDLLERCLLSSTSMTVLYYYHPGSDRLYDVKSSTAEHFGVEEEDVDQSDCEVNEDCIRVDIQLPDDAPPVVIDGLYESVGSIIHVESIVLIYPCVDAAFTDDEDECDDVITMSLSFGNVNLYETDENLILRNLTANRIYYLKLLQMSMTLPFEDAGQNGLDFTLYLCEESLTAELACPHYIMYEEDLQYYSDYIENAMDPDEFLEVANGSAHVCTLPEVNLTYLSIMYTILSSLSIILLIVAFLIYCVFNFLRNGPGKLVMNFFVAVALSQLVLLLGATQTLNPAVCTTFAVAGHYTWLVVFLWISIIAYSVSSTFGGAMMSHRSKLSNKTLMVIITIGWGTPAIFVGICVMVRYLDLFSFDYGNSKGCWIRPGRVNLLLFGVPSACCLLFNLVMFVRTSIGIRRSMEGAKRVHENKSEVFKDEVVLYIKVSILMGFCWVWAFLSGFFPASLPLLILYVIFTPSQGILVFFIYICNRRMMSKWRSIFSQASSSKSRSSKITMVSSTNTGRDGLTKTTT